MRMNLMKTLSLTLLLAVAVASCKKDKASTIELLTNARGWILVGYTVSPAFVDPITGTSISDWYAQLETCEKDNLVFFQGDNVFITDEGATKCDPDDPQTDPGTWLLSADEKTVTIDGESYTIEKLDKNTLRMTFTEEFLGVIYTWTFALEHP